MRLYVFNILVVLFSLSCTNFNNKQQEPLAQVYNNYLYRDDISLTFPPGISETDSIKMTRVYIDKWIRNQLFLKLAEHNLPEPDKNIDKEISEFRATLLIYKYQQHLLNQRLDSIIGQDEIQEYYNNHDINFILEKPAVRGVFLKVPADAPNRDRLLTMFRADDELMQIEDYRNQYAVHYSWFNENWIYLDEILNELPRGSFNPNGITNVDHIRVTDSDFHYFIGIKEYRAARGPMPLSLASRKIESIILNKRKIQLLNELEKNVFTEGLSKNAYQYY
jgi:hypothetical protein